MSSVRFMPEVKERGEGQPCFMSLLRISTAGKIGRP